jgi:colanic acid/amylovoran/stewartan biosynthesis glycosyltransferase WcaL/AmsK/CpsK
VLTVLHRCRVWLPRTQTWIHTQLVHLPPRIAWHVLCEAVEHLDQFSVPNLHVLPSASPWARFRRAALRRTRVYRMARVRFGAAVARATGASVLHSHFGYHGWEDMVLARRAGLKHVVTFYGEDVVRVPRQEPVWRARYREMFAAADRILCEGPHMAARVGDLGCPLEKLRVHHLGVPIASIPFRPRRWSPGEPLGVLIAASFVEKKGIPDALEALGRLQRDVPLRITVIGDATDAPGSREVKRAILACAERHRFPSLRMLGFQPHAALHEEAQRHHVFLSPSVEARDGDSEGGAPVSLIEMAASGMAVVSTRHCDIPQVILEGKTGLLADERDVDGLVACLRRLLADPGAWGAMLEAGRRHVESEFDAATQGERLARVYEDLMAGAGA